MFLRKLVVIFVPLLLTALLCVALPMLEGIPFWTEALQGAVLGLGLALLLPLAGASRRREPFAHLLWVPALLLFLTVICQYLLVIGIQLPVVDVLRTTDSNVILAECAFLTFMAVQLFRTRK